MQSQDFLSRTFFHSAVFVNVRFFNAEPDTARFFNAGPDIASFFVTVHHNKQDFFHSVVFANVLCFYFDQLLGTFSLMVSQQETEKW